MAEAERNGTWIVSLSDVGAWTWDADDGLRVVVVRIPVGDPNFRILLDNSAVDRDIAVADTAENRQWVQDCMRGDERFELFRQQTVDILTGAMDAPPVTPERARESYANRTLSNGRSCLGGLGGFEELRAHYWWTDAGLDCASRQSMAYAQEGDRVKPPLEVCPTISHNPATAPEWPALDAQQRLADPPEAVRWLMARCQEIVAANPNPAYPTDPYGPYLTGDPLPTCWDDKVAVITGHAASAAVNTMAGASAVSHAHRCYHAFLGYAWARQTGRESRGPDNLEIGCYYYAHRAVP